MLLDSDLGDLNDLVGFDKYVKLKQMALYQHNLDADMCSLHPLLINQEQHGRSSKRNLSSDVCLLTAMKGFWWQANQHLP